MRSDVSSITCGSESRADSSLISGNSPSRCFLQPPSRRVQNKAAQSNQEKKSEWGRYERNRDGGGGGEKEPLDVCVRLCVRVSGSYRALLHQSHELRGLRLALRGVQVSKIQNNPLHRSHCLREKVGAMLLFLCPRSNLSSLVGM